MGDLAICPNNDFFESILHAKIILHYPHKIYPFGQNASIENDLVACRRQTFTNLPVTSKTLSCCISLVAEMVTAPKTGLKKIDKAAEPEGFGSVMETGWVTSC